MIEKQGGISVLFDTFQVQQCACSRLHFKPTRAPLINGRIGTIVSESIALETRFEILLKPSLKDAALEEGQWQVGPRIDFDIHLVLRTLSVICG